MYILLEGIEIKKSQDLTASVVSPKWCHNFLFYWTGVSAKIVEIGD